MNRKRLQAFALRVAYHIEQKLGGIHGQPKRTLIMMVSAFLMSPGPWLSDMGRTLADLPGSLKQKVKRMSRFLCQSAWVVEEAFAEMGQKMVETVAHAHPKRRILLALDWTQLGDFKALWLSMPYRGRAIPLFCKIVAEGMVEGAMTLTEVELLEEFLRRLPDDLRDRIVFLCDRGFAKRELFEVIRNEKAHFVVRLPRNRHILLDGKWTRLCELNLSAGEERFLRQVQCNQEDPIPLHLAIRRLQHGQANDPDDDVWYLATDLEDLDRACRRYESRFQIEEMFRDFKSEYHLEDHLLGTEESVAKMMLIASLAYRITIEEGLQRLDRLDRNKIERQQGWGKLSIFTLASWAFELTLQEVPQEIGEDLLSRFTNRTRGSMRNFLKKTGS